jgi:hypothetical protein
VGRRRLVFLFFDTSTKKKREGHPATKKKNEKKKKMPFLSFGSFGSALPAFSSWLPNFPFSFFFV